MKNSSACLLLAFLLPAAVASSGSSKIGTMTRAEFDRLPPDQIIELSTTKMTKRAFLAELEKLRARGPVATSRLKPTRESLNADLARTAAARIAADNSRVLALKPQVLGMVRLCPAPKIEAILHVPPVEPGEEFFLKGCGFGDVSQYESGSSPRSLKLHLNEGAKSIEVLEWKAGYIHGRIYQGWSGVQDQQASLIVTTATGKSSNPWPIQFRAAREKVALTPSDVTISCGGPAYDNCRMGNIPTTVEAFHDYSCFDIGVDKVSASLKNGWTFRAAALNLMTKNDPPNHRLLVMEGFQEGSASTQIKLVWLYIVSNAAETGIHYWLDLYAEGVRGTSYK